MADVPSVLLVLALVAALAGAGRTIRRMAATIRRQRAALQALGEVALQAGVRVQQIRAAVGPHVQVHDLRPDATTLMTRIPASSTRRRPRPYPPRPYRSYAAGRAPVRGEEHP